METKAHIVHPPKPKKQSQDKVVAVCRKIDMYDWTKRKEKVR